MGKNMKFFFTLHVLIKGYNSVISKIRLEHTFTKKKLRIVYNNWTKWPKKLRGKWCPVLVNNSSIQYLFHKFLFFVSQYWCKVGSNFRFTQIQTENTKLTLLVSLEKTKIFSTLNLSSLQCPRDIKEKEAVHLAK